MASTLAFSAVSSASQGKPSLFDAVVLAALQAAGRGANLRKVVVVARGLFSAVSQPVAPAMPAKQRADPVRTPVSPASNRLAVVKQLRLAAGAGGLVASGLRRAQRPPAPF